ncbi:efflux transporter outer membrane subunit [Methylophilus sp. TWE2]|uniref:efflux transporter outer membrane subunit n=1 Tax=Methylophilus sp. TWE2 TaxID=1662285 RepID=UPI000670FB5E|nr:efflux transporter outer membrane subunit [Methylophilus sp. TWE2]AKR42105.1 hypothetical protein ACJ67_00630 [Methylophilus sp. TWE2]
MGKHARWYWLCLIVPLAGCTVLEEYIRPKPETPTQWQAPPPHEGKLLSLKDWWGQFNDPVLNELLAQAQKENPSLELALANISSARANLGTAFSQGIPSLTANGSFTESKGANAALGASTVKITSGTLDASWELDLFGKIKAGKQAAIAQLESREMAWHDARITLAAEVANNYVNYRACRENVDALQQALDSRRETARLTGISSKAGFTSPADLSLAEAAMRASESTLDGQQAECDGLVKALVALTNLPEAKLQSVLAQGKGLPQPALFDVQALPAELLTRRPDLVRDERNLAEASANIGVSKAALYPSLSLTGSIGYRQTTINGTVIRGQTWSYGPSLKLPLFDGGANRAAIEADRATFDNLLATYKQNVRNAVKEVEQALVNLNSATRRVQSESESAAQYRQYFKVAEMNWKSGGLDLLSLEDARRQKINAELNVITQQKNRVLQWIALYKAFGGDWLETRQTVKPPLKPMEKR